MDTTIDKLKSRFSSAKSNTIMISILIMIVVAVLAVVLVFIIKQFASSGLRLTNLTPNTVSLVQAGNLPITVPANKLPSTVRGQEFTFSFWLYLNDVFETSTDHRVIFYRGMASGNMTTIDTHSNPIVMIDKANNVLYVALSTNIVPKSNALPLNDIIKLGNGFLVGRVDYIPLQRWVHFGVVIRDSSLTIYMDGDIYAVNTTNDIITADGVRPLIAGSSGDINIGNPANTIKGYMSKLEFGNYALSDREMRKLYSSGPSPSSFMSYFGMGNYGIRSPIYSIN
jgi:hypothetical protein